MNITSKVDRDSLDNARIDRERNTNPAAVEPGMDDFDWDDGAPSSSGDSDLGGWGSNLGGTGMDNPFGPPAGGGLGGGLGGGNPFGPPPPAPFGGFGGFGQPPEPPKKDTDEAVWQFIGNVFKGFFTFSGDFVKSFKTFDIMARMKTAKAVLITGAVVAFIGVVLSFFGLGALIGFDFLVGGLVATGGGIILFMWSYDDVVKNGMPELPEPEEEFPSAFDADDGGFTFEDTDLEDEDDEFSMFSDDEDEDEDFDLFGDEDEAIDFAAFEETDPAELESKREQVLDTLENNNGMYTRQYLYENVSSALVNVNQGFDRIKYISEDSNEFDAWDAIIQNSAGVFKPKGSEVDMPYLISAKEKIFYVLLEVKRVNWIKNIDAFVTEIVNICRYDEETGNRDMNIYGIGDTVGDKIFIKIMKGETAMVTVKDVYKNVEDKIKDSKNAMPIVLGLDAEGSVVYRDFKDINSILVTGMPRSGKTWFVQAVLAQMTFFLKPSELHFHILDPKDQISDFRKMQMPHIRKFVSKEKDILAELKRIVKVEGPRRKKIIGDAGFVNISDYKKRNPDVDLPLLYVVIDEVITLAESMDKETKDEFQSLLLELVSQLPALGIRIFMIPHVVKDQVLKKSITDLIPCRISVRGDAEHIEKSVSAKNFKHKLTHQGDMAVRFNNDEPIFVHSAVLTDSNEGNEDLFKFLLKFWSKLEPESLQGSLYEQNEASLNIALNKANSQSKITLDKSSSNNTVNLSDYKNRVTAKDVDDLVSSLHDVDKVDIWND